MEVIVAIVELDAASSGGICDEESLCDRPRPGGSSRFSERERFERELFELQVPESVDRLAAPMDGLVESIVGVLLL